MRTFVINLLISLAILYNFFELNPAIKPDALNALLALIVIKTILWLLSFFYDRKYFSKLPVAISLILYFIKELVIANLRVTLDAVSPRFKMKPAVVAYPLLAESDLEITLLSCLITLTPGTLTIDISENRKVLYFHTMYLKDNDIDKTKEQLRSGFEKRILAVTR